MLARTLAHGSWITLTALAIVFGTAHAWDDPAPGDAPAKKTEPKQDAANDPAGGKDAAEKNADPPPADGEAPEGGASDGEASSEPDLPGLKKLAPSYDVWIDKKNRRVVMQGEVVLREGPLEMFACPVKTKEHESIVAIKTKAYVVHAALLIVGAKPGTPVEFQPEFKPPTGTEIEVTVQWKDPEGKKHEARAQDWIANERSGEPMEHKFVFAGSGFYVDPNTGRRAYLAEDGDLICVSNFVSAMIDVAAQSSQMNDALLFAANTKAIPPMGTEVTIILTPKLDDEKQPDAKDEPEGGKDEDAKDDEPADDAPKKDAGKDGAGKDEPSKEPAPKKDAEKDKPSEKPAPKKDGEAQDQGE